jgi:hypothetical protein
VFVPKPAVTPGFEVVDFIRYQQSDSFSKLFLEKKSVKTHFCEHSFDIIQHGEHALKKVGLFGLTNVKLENCLKI